MVPPMWARRPVQEVGRQEFQKGPEINTGPVTTTSCLPTAELLIRPSTPTDPAIARWFLLLCFRCSVSRS